MILKRALSLAVAGALVAFTAPVFAHGGQYRGPGDTVPPNPGGGGGGRTPTPGGPTTPGPGGPTTPNPTGPGTGGPTTPPPPPSTGGGGRQAGPTTGAVGMVISDDLTQWQFWWEFNKDPYLQLKSAIHQGAITSGSDDFELGRARKAEARSTLKPSDSDRQTVMIPALLKALEDPSSNRDIVSSCMIALAKIGSSADPTMFKEQILPVFKKFLPDQDQEKRETAALAMGIAALPEAVPDLIELAKDSQGGRKLCERPQGVDYRTRAFAAYGLGLIAYRNNDPELKAKVFETMKGILDDKEESRRDMQVAALQAIRLLRPDPSQQAGQELQKRLVEYCLAYLANDDVYDQIRSHALSAMGKLLERGGDEKLVEQVVNKCMEVLENKRRKFKKWTQQSAVQSLGLLANEENSKAVKLLERYAKDGKDAQAQNFAAIALGEIGGKDAREFLYKQLRSNSVQKMFKPWIALGLAVRDFNLRQNDNSYDGDRTIGDEIVKQLRANRNALYAAGYAIALGMMQYRDAGDILLDRLVEVKNQDEPAGYFMVGLGLMRYMDSTTEIRTIVQNSSRREKLLTQGSIALGLLGDKAIAEELVRKMEEQGTVAVMSALAQALGFIGDRRSIDPLVEILGNKGLKDIPRAFAAVALGLVGDKEDLPWNSKVAVNANYRANVETLTSSSGTGILDIL
jgi:HEAT repeat protein